jgi:hypothetical protein
MYITVHHTRDFYVLYFYYTGVIRIGLSAFRPQGVPGPTSKLSLRVPAQMGRRETEHKGGKQ